MSLAEVYAVLLLWTRRYRQLHDSGDVPFAMIFKNNGFEAGATQQHPHSQLIGFPVVPAHTKEMLNCARTYHEVNGKCCYCAMAQALRKPSEDKERPTGSELVVYQNDLFVAFCPWAPPCDYAIYILPWALTADLLLDVADGRSHATSGSVSSDSSNAGQRTLAALADCLRMAARKLYVFCGNPSYNLVVRNPPFSARRAEWYHWHIELAPKFSKSGGLEYGTHCMVLMMLPEVAAKNLRETDVNDATEVEHAGEKRAEGGEEGGGDLASSRGSVRQKSWAVLSALAGMGEVSALDAY